MKRNNTIVSKVTKYLRHEITYRNLKAGMHLKESEIAKKLSISRVPVREAFRILESEGYIKLIPNRGSYVTKICWDQIIEISRVNRLLAPVVLEKAIPRYTERTCIKAGKILDRIESSRDFGEIGYLIWDFAKVIYEPSKMQFVVSIFEEIYKLSLRMLNEFFDTADLANFKVNKHRLFIELCKNKKTDDAILLWVNYLDELKEMILLKESRKNKAVAN